MFPYAVLIRRLLPSLLVLSAVAGIVCATPVQADPTPTADAPRAAGPVTLPPGGSFVPVPTYRIFDSRGTGVRTSYTFFSGSVGHDADAGVLLSVTVTNAVAPGWIRLGDADTDPAVAATNGNFVQGETTSFLALVPADNVQNFDWVGATLSQPADLIVDLEGYVTQPQRATTTYTPINPVRVADTRTGAGLTRLGPQQTQQLAVRERAGLPTGASAVLANLTIAGSTASTFLVGWDGGGDRPEVSQVSAPAGAIRSSRVLLPVAPDGTVRIYNNLGDTDVVVDVVGYVSNSAAGSYFTPVAASRLSDRFTGSESVVNPTVDAPPTDVSVWGPQRAPSTDDVAPTTAVWVNVAVDQPSADGAVTVHATGRPRPATSDVNAVVGHAMSTAVAVAVGPRNESLTVDTAGRARVIVDLGVSSGELPGEAH